MSGPFAIAGVTAVLKDLLNKQLAHPDFAELTAAIGSFSVTSIAPDRITTGTQEPNQLNLFLYQINANQAWVNREMPSRDSDYRQVSNPPLALDLHYLLTAYGAQDFNDEILLGCAIQAFHETPVISRAYIRTVLDNSSGPPKPSPFDRLSAVDLADQVELIKITPKFLNTEELSKLWTAMQARYRQTMAYQVSVVLIQSKKSVRAALPVLSRGQDDRGVAANPTIQSSFPVLQSLHLGPSTDGATNPLPKSFPGAQIGFQIILQGQNFTGDTVTVEFKHTRYSEPGHPEFIPVKKLTVPGSDRNATEIKLTLSEPDGSMPPTPWRIGLYSVKVIVTKDSKTHASNELPLALVPSVVGVAPANPISRMAGTATVTLTCKPQVLIHEEAALLLGDLEVKAETRSTDTDTLVFVVNNAPVVNDLPIRLRVNGVDSIPFERTVNSTGFQFAESQKVSMV